MKELNLPEDDGSEFYKSAAQLIKSIRKSSEMARAGIWNQFGFKIWEEPEDEYLNRMEEAGYLVIR